MVYYLKTFQHKMFFSECGSLVTILLVEYLAPIHAIGYFSCLTFWEDCGPLAAVLCESLALIGGAGACAARIAKKKSLTHNTIMSSSADRDIPHFPRTCLYGSTAYQVYNAKDIHKYWNLLSRPGKGCSIWNPWGEGLMEKISITLHTFFFFVTQRTCLIFVVDIPKQHFIFDGSPQEHLICLLHWRTYLLLYDWWKCRT